jgi:hypothetical protein
MPAASQTQWLGKYLASNVIYDAYNPNPQSRLHIRTNKFYRDLCYSIVQFRAAAQLSILLR